MILHAWPVLFSRTLRMWIVNLILLKHEIQPFSLANIGHVIYQLTVPRDWVTRWPRARLTVPYVRCGFFNNVRLKWDGWVFIDGTWTVQVCGIFLLLFKDQFGPWPWWYMSLFCRRLIRWRYDTNEIWWIIVTVISLQLGDVYHLF